MSRIGKKPIKLREGVTAEVLGSTIKIKGPDGELSCKIRPEVEVNVEGDIINISKKKETKKSNAYWGLTRSLVNNMVIGVSEGYEKTLELVGVGYRAKPIEGGISLTVGYSHPIEFRTPDGVNIELEDDKKIIVKGIDKQLVGLTAAKIRKIRKPEPYKGKGIRYSDEVVRRKPGKAGKI